MKVVLFCGGYGLRMRDGMSDAPKPMAMIGERPLLWHVMRYYAHFGHTRLHPVPRLRRPSRSRILPRLRRDLLERLRADAAAVGSRDC